MKTIKLGEIEYVDLPTLEEEFGITFPMMRTAVRKGKIVKYKIGGRTLFRVDDLPKLVEPSTPNKKHK